MKDSYHTLEVACDTPVGVSRTYRHNTKQTFIGETEAECIQMASAAGWHLSERRDFCPACNKEQERLVRELEQL